MTARIRCPHDFRFVHVDGTCQPRRPENHTQTVTEVDGLPGPVAEWDGGCDAAGITRQVRQHFHSADLTFPEPKAAA